jgi:RNA polymerase sigma-70 factor (ECF subfamily)
MEEPLKPIRIERKTGGSAFPTTRWSVVDRAGSDEAGQQAALCDLCEQYWIPVYSYVRRRGYASHDAEDLTQGFLGSLISRNPFGTLSKENGRFRSFLLKCLQHFLSSDREKNLALKRGGGRVHLWIDGELGEETLWKEAGLSGDDPEVIFERQWVIALLKRTLDRLGDRYSEEGKEEQFEQLRPFLTGDEMPRGSYGELAAAQDTTPEALRMAVFRMRERYRKLLRDEIGRTVSDPVEIDSEIDYLFRVFH